MTPEEIKALQEQFANLQKELNTYKQKDVETKENEMKQKGQWEQLLTQKITEQSAQFDKKYKETEAQYQARIGAMEKEFHVLKVKNVIESIVGDKVKEDLADFVIQDAVSKFKIKDGNPVMLDDNGTPVLFEGKPITPQSYIDQVLTKKPSLLKGSKGAGTPKDAGNGGGSGVVKLDLNDPAGLAAAYEKNPEAVKAFMREQGLSM